MSWIRTSQTSWWRTNETSLGVSFETCLRHHEGVLMRRCCYVLLKRRHDVPSRCPEDVPLRRLPDVPSGRRWVFHLRCTWDVTGMYRERRYDVATMSCCRVGVAWFNFDHVKSSSKKWHKKIKLPQMKFTL